MTFETLLDKKRSHILLEELGLDRGRRDCAELPQAGWQEEENHEKPPRRLSQLQGSHSTRRGLTLPRM